MPRNMARADIDAPLTPCKSRPIWNDSAMCLPRTCSSRPTPLHWPAAACFGKAFIEQLIACDETETRIARRDVLQGLGDISADDEVCLHPLPQIEADQRIPGGCTIRCGVGIGDGQSLLAEILKSQAAVVTIQCRVPGPQHKVPNRVGESAAGDTMTGGLEQSRALHIGRQQHVKRRTVCDLRIKHSGRGRTHANGLPRLSLETRGKIVYSCLEIACHRDCDGLGTSIGCEHAEPASHKRGEDASGHGYRDLIWT